MKYKNLLNFHRIIKATKYSFQGIRLACKHEAAFRQELILMIILIPVAIILNISVVERILLISSLLFILIIELINSAVETVIDRFSVEQHPLSGKAKDLGSAAVFVSIIMAIYIWSSVILSLNDLM